MDEKPQPERRMEKRAVVVEGRTPPPEPATPPAAAGDNLSKRAADAFAAGR